MEAKIMQKVIEFPDKSLIEKEAGELILRFDGLNNPSERDIEELKAWADRSPLHRETLIGLAELWDGMESLSELKVARRQSRVLSFVGAPYRWLVRLTHHLTSLIPAVRVPVLTAILVLGISLLSWFTVNQLPDEDGNIYFTQLGESKSFSLADGSRIWLNTDTEVRVDYDELSRTIYLNRGEAHFEVQPNSNRPFSVYVDSRLVRAVGTAFSVFRDNGNVSVLVTEGKVDLGIIQSKQALVEPLENITKENDTGINHDSQNSSVEVIGSLEAGQSVVVYASQEGEELQSIVNLEDQEVLRRLAWREGQLIFAGETLQEVVREVSRYTEVRIEIPDSEIQSIRVGGQFPVGATDALFDTLETGFGLQVRYLSNNYVQILASR